MLREVRNFQDDFNKLKTESLEKNQENGTYKKLNMDLSQKCDKQNEKIDMLKELLDLKNEEALLYEKEKKNYIVALEKIRREETKLSSLKKVNSEMRNQLEHYKALVRRLKANQLANLTLTGPDGVPIPVPQKDGFGNDVPIDPNKIDDIKDIYGFLDLKKKFDDSLTEEERCQILNQVIFIYLFNIIFL